MKNAILMLLLVLSFSFAKPPIPPPDLDYPHGHVFLHSMCLYNQLGNLLYRAESSYWVYDGKECVSPDLSSHDSAIMDAFYGDGSPGLVYLYQSVLWACEGGPATRECIDASIAFYHAAHDARGVFLAAKTAYILSAGQAISANSRGLCKNYVPGIYEDIQGSMGTYRDCMQGGPG